MPPARSARQGAWAVMAGCSGEGDFPGMPRLYHDAASEFIENIASEQTARINIVNQPVVGQFPSSRQLVQ